MAVHRPFRPSAKVISVKSGRGSPLFMAEVRVIFWSWPFWVATEGGWGLLVLLVGGWRCLWCLFIILLMFDDGDDGDKDDHYFYCRSTTYYCDSSH